MKLLVNFGSLHDSVKKMAAAERDFNLAVYLPELDTIDARLEFGIEVNIDEIEMLDNGLLSYEGRQVLLYIQDHGWKIADAIEDGAVGKKYHVAYCQTLDSMHSRGRYDRYVVKHDISGYFYVDGIDRDTKDYEDGEAQLVVCKNCLKHLDYHGYDDANWGEKKKIFSDFLLKEFFDEYLQYFKFKPKYNSGKKKSAYSSNWRDISQTHRESVSWVCEGCSVDLAGNKDLLHTHHKNGVKSDNVSSNLKALCVKCHIGEPGHSHMKIKDTHKQKLQTLRLKQGVAKV
ncbi:MAG: hypothetical protein ACI9FB_003822 [Candidatus Azotimanducaceae bacterium]|jgi:hypothetical protein